MVLQEKRNEVAIKCDKHWSRQESQPIFWQPQCLSHLLPTPLRFPCFTVTFHSNSQCFDSRQQSQRRRKLSVTVVYRSIELNRLNILQI